MSRIQVLGLEWLIGLFLCILTLPGVWAQSGAKAWEYVMRKEVTSSPVIGGDGGIYLGGNDGYLYALTSGGVLRWELNLASPIVATISLGSDGTVYAACTDGSVYAVSPIGKKVWQYKTGSSVEASLALGVDDTLFVGCMDGRVLALTGNGQLLWSYSTRGAVHSSPVVGSDGTVFVGDRVGWLYALSQSGGLAWEYKIGAAIEGSPVIGENGMILCGAMDYRLYAFRPDGTKLWDYTTKKGIYNAPAVGLDGTIYVASNDGNLYALNTVGTNLWQVALDSAVGSSSPAIASDGTICVASSQGVVTAVRADGVKKWTFTAPAGINYSSPTIGSDGTVYVGCQDAHLYALRGTAALQSGGWPCFRRDARGTATGFVRRYAPSSYSPGGKLGVRLVAVPPPRVTFYTVEDYVPSGWVVSDLTDGGSFDSVTRRVLFGPFLDGTPRTLSYSATPPTTDTGLKTLTGIGSANDGDRMTYGVSALKYVPLHPADSRPTDGWITLNEVTAYGAAWRKGTTWPLGVVPIPSAYLNKAIQLWRGGEEHRCDTNFPSAPEWWVPSTDPSMPAPNPPADGVTATNGYARAAFLPSGQDGGSNVTVVIAVTPMTNTFVYALEEKPPAGWQVSNISDGGIYDASTGKVKWGPFFDALARDLTYQVQPAASSGQFLGWVSIDNSIGEILGQRTLNLGDPSVALGRALRTLPSTFSPGAATTVTLSVRLTNVTAWAVEENVPVGWQVTNISAGGYFDTSSRTVRFGLFQDGLARDLSYALLPPFTETNTIRITGALTVDGVLFACEGDTYMAPSPLHPADLSSPDHWVSATELTQYALAWKKGIAWAVAPTSIPPDYLSRASLLWRGGELYRVDTSVPSAPEWWVVDGSQPGQTNPIAPVLTTLTNGVVLRQIPSLLESGVAVQVTLTAIPNTNVQVYVVEDRPPDGWQLLQVDGGFADPQRGKAKWGPFYDNLPRTLTYIVRPIASVSQICTFDGGAAYDGVYSRMLGDRDVFVQVNTGGPAFAERSLPGGYSPGGKLVVQVHVTGGDSVGYYVVEEQVPTGWTTGAISDFGSYDAVTRRVKFGPYFDGAARSLSYEIIPPLTETNTVQIVGYTLVDGMDGFVGGDRNLVLLQMHPADNASVDGWMTMSEMTAYIAGWKRGTIWPIAPNPIPADYVTRAVRLWQGGENYAVDRSVTNAPDWWVNITNQPLPGLLPAIPAGSLATNGTAKCTFPRLFDPMKPFVVTLLVTPATNVQACAFEDQPPSGWKVTAITGGGFWDAYLGKVKWGPFFDHQVRSVSYTVLPPANATAGIFQGGAAFDFDNADYAGSRRAYSSAQPPSGIVYPISLLSTQGFQLYLGGAPYEAYRIDQSSNLVDWAPLTVLTNFSGSDLNGTNGFLDPRATNQPMRFYRSTWLP